MPFELNFLFVVFKGSADGDRFDHEHWKIQPGSFPKHPHFSQFLSFQTYCSIFSCSECQNVVASFKSVEVFSACVRTLSVMERWEY